MTDQATTEAAKAGTSEGANASGDNGANPPVVAETFAGLQDAGNREWVAGKGYKDLDALTTSARRAETLDSELSSLKATALTPPAQDAPKEQWDAFYAKLGRPEKAEGYEFALPADLPQDMPYDSEGAKMYRDWSHEAGLTPRQAQIIHDKFARYQAGQYQQQMQSFNQRTTAATEALTKAWGGDLSSDTYKQNQQFADRFIAENGGDALMQELKANGTIAENGMILSPLMAQALAKAGAALYKEDKLVTGEQPKGQKSAASILYPEDPFKKG